MSSATKVGIMVAENKHTKVRKIKVIVALQANNKEMLGCRCTRLTRLRPVPERNVGTADDRQRGVVHGLVKWVLFHRRDVGASGRGCPRLKDLYIRVI
jgi:hypothetical protein